MTAVVIVRFRGEQRRRTDGWMASVVTRESRRGHCTGGEVSSDTLDMHAVGHEDPEQEHGQGQYAQQGARTRAGPEHAQGRPSRNHAVI
ncbi:hypothetical protein, partial [Streptomyces cupreus]|uniref:hypothetical protein n=1 Tax=Streptomyces cupreus TaxID=2759956 RepID=UPI001C919EB9